jgi:hypothetical protein
MRLGLLGLGRIGAFHAETLTSVPTVDSLVVSDPMSALVEEIAGRLGTHVADTPEALLASGVDGVVIAAPTDLHPELIPRCVAGIPAFCEKPVARDSALAAELARRVGDAGVQVQIGTRAGSTRPSPPPAPRWPTATSARFIRSGPPRSTPPRRHGPTSPPPAESSGTAPCTTSTPSGG